ncbi:MAG: hypothetical protein LBT33_08950 [Spirochaetia bacterium]|jgi:hypothetical protein|nr:hypothetical protein [Spirochaetia bacterium]
MDKRKVPVNFVTIGLIHIVIGFGLSLFFCYVLKKNFIGKVWGAALVGTAGSFTGGLANVLVQDIRFLSLVFFSVNIIPPCIVSCLFLWIFNKISSAPETY